MTVPKEQVMESAVLREEVFTSPLAGEVGPKGRVGSGDMHFPSMGRLLLPIHGEVAPKAPEGLCQP